MSELGYSRVHYNNVFILMFDMKISSREFWSEVNTLMFVEFLLKDDVLLK